MEDAEGGGDSIGEREVGRLAAFSDGVFAIAITLLVLPLTEEDVTAGRVAETLGALVPQMLTFLLSFAVVGRYWVLHHGLLRTVVRSDTRLLSLNLVFLFWVALLPFPTNVLGEADDTTAAVVFYAVSIIATGVSAAALELHVLRSSLSGSRASVATLRNYLSGVLVPSVAFLPSLPIAFVSPGVAKLSWLLTIPVGLLQDRWFPPGGEATGATGRDGS